MTHTKRYLRIRTSVRILFYTSAALLLTVGMPLLAGWIER